MSASYDNGTLAEDLNNKLSSSAGASSGRQLNGARPQNNTPGRSDNPLVNVQPPRREDLQPSYAQTLHGDDQSSHGWYGSMSKSHLRCAFTHGRLLIYYRVQSIPWVHVSVLLVPFPAVLSAPIHTSQYRKVTLVWLRSSADSTELSTQVL